MKRFSVALILLGLLGCSQKAPAPAVTELKSHQDSISYSIGMDIGTNLNRQMIELTPEVMYQGFMDGYQDQEPLLTEEQRREVIVAFQKELRDKQQQHQQVQAAENLKDSREFLDENAKQAGVVTLPSGLQYKILTAGTGKKPGPDDRVKVHYEGTLVDETVFDSSLERGQPTTFKVSGVIPGWSEALQLMPVGSKWKLFVPPDLAYGERGAGGKIKPNSALIFEVELLAIEN